MDNMKALWEAASVERFHAVPHHQPYSVGMHSYRMLVLLFKLHPQPTIELIKQVMFHDSAERWLGDVPAPAKWYIVPGIAGKLQEAERNILNKLGAQQNLLTVEENWLKALDLLELHLFCVDEANMGNCNLYQCRTICHNILMSSDWVPQEITQWLKDLTWERTDDSFGMRS